MGPRTAAEAEAGVLLVINPVEQVKCQGLRAAGTTAGLDLSSPTTAQRMCSAMSQASQTGTAWKRVQKLSLRRCLTIAKASTVPRASVEASPKIVRQADLEAAEIDMMIAAVVVETDMMIAAVAVETDTMIAAVAVETDTMIAAVAV